MMMILMGVFLLVVHGKLLKSAGGLELDDVIGITGHQSQHLETFNQQPVQLGRPAMDPAFREEIEQALNDEDQQQQLNKDENIENVSGNDSGNVMEWVGTENDSHLYFILYLYM
jgi:hypothetical protein